MEQIYIDTIKGLGYTEFVTDIFGNWENVKDEVLLPERKAGTANGTVHVFLGQNNTSTFERCFHEYYQQVYSVKNPDLNIPVVKHVFLCSNILSMFGFASRFIYHSTREHLEDYSKDFFNKIDALSVNNCLITTSYFKLSFGSGNWRPYFKQFAKDGAFHELIRPLLIPTSTYKIGLYKNNNGEYAAIWQLGFKEMTDAQTDVLSDFIVRGTAYEQDISLQQIFYGAPGTGKSHKIKKYFDDNSIPTDNIFRTTFHSDSDYSTFVGAYKPTMKQVPEKYQNVQGRQEEITYQFIPQAFLQAYIRAYQTTDNVYLVIEEINRGNCAQIFGDLFQLLDRDESGKSEYCIKADTDLCEFLKKELGEDNEGIKDSELCLPPNLYIWATMNTSDQSLFPIDSAFKRRWDWEYMPIGYNNNLEIQIGGNKYSWTDFQRNINERIFKIDSSEDKQLGDFFVNPHDGIITSDVLLNKILFYLWNDVCKDDPSEIFKIKTTQSEEEITFSGFFCPEKDVKLQELMAYIGVEPTESQDNAIDRDIPDDDPNALSSETKQWYRDMWDKVIEALGNKGIDNLPNTTDRRSYQKSVGITGVLAIAMNPRTKKDCWAGIYIEAAQAPVIWPKLKSIKDEIDTKLPGIKWSDDNDANGYRRIYLENSFSNEEQAQAIAWIADNFAKFYSIFSGLISDGKLK